MESGPGARDAQPPGVLASLRGLALTAVAIAQTRLQLLGNELEEQKIRGAQLLALGAVAFFCAAVGILLITAWIVIALWDRYRLLTVGILALLYFGGCALALWRLKAKAAARPKLFAASLAELRRDRDLLSS
jgi:uncharacterized membrane protein YqjE